MVEASSVRPRVILLLAPHHEINTCKLFKEGDMKPFKKSGIYGDMHQDAKGHQNIKKSNISV